MADLKKALIFYLYGNRNAGDMAICVGAIELLKSKGYGITMISRFSEFEDEYFKSKQYINEYYPEVQVYPGPFSFERDFSKLKKLKSYSQSFLKMIGIIKDKQIQQLIDEADVVFFNGGNLLRGSCIADYLRLMALFYPIKLAHRKSKPIYCLPQSTAKISKIGESLLNKYLKLFDVVYIRERISFEKLKKIFPNIKFKLSTDLAFFCVDNQYISSKLNDLNYDFSKENNVALILRDSSIGDIGKLELNVMNNLYERVSLYIKEHKDNHYFIVVQTEKDREISERMFNEHKSMANIDILELHDPLLLREIYKKMKLTISMRLHAAILSLSALTPVYGVFSEQWGLKKPGIMESYNMSYVVIEDESNKEIQINYGNNVKSNISNRIEEYKKEMKDI